MNIIVDKDPIFEVEKYDVVLLGASVMCQLSRAGFVAKMSNKYPILQEEDDKQTYNDHRRLGTRLTLTIQDDLRASLLYMSHSVRFTTSPSSMRIDYNALERCLRTANAEFKGLRVITNIIGTDSYLGSGDKDKCLDLIERCTPNLDLDVYDYPDIPITKIKQTIQNQIRSRCHNDEALIKATFKRLSLIYKKLYLVPTTPKNTK